MPFDSLLVTPRVTGKLCRLAELLTTPLIGSPFHCRGCITHSARGAGLGALRDWVTVANHIVQYNPMKSRRMFLRRRQSTAWAECAMSFLGAIYRCGWLDAYRLSNMVLCLGDRSSQTVCTRCNAEMEVTDQTFYLTRSQYTDTGLTSPSADPVTPGAWQGSHWGTNVEVRYDSTRTKIHGRKPESNPGLLPSRRTPYPLGQRARLSARSRAERRSRILSYSLALLVYETHFGFRC